MAFWSWSRTAGNNTTADSTINWAEGQAPSTVNDSARAMMARTAEYRDDIAGAITTGGTSTAYTLTSYQVFDSFAHMANQMIAFVPHTSNGGFCSINVDGLGARNIRFSPNADLPAGTLVQGTPYVITYNNSDQAWYLRNFLNVPWFIPIGASVDFWGATSPSSSFVFPYGQAISRSTYSTLFSLISTTFGVGDGSTTFNLPDLRGRVTASPDNMGGGSDPNRLTGSASMASIRNSVGGAGGVSSIGLAANQIPTITSSVSVSGTSTGSTGATNLATGNTTTGGGGFLCAAAVGSTSLSVSVSGTMTGSATSNNTGSTAVDNVQPTILCNRIMRII